MTLSDREANVVFSIMQDLSGDFDHQEVRRNVGKKLLTLLNADYFASYIWDTQSDSYVSCVQINMSDANLAVYEQYYQFHDPITPILQKRRKATLVSHVMEHKKLMRTEFFNDFLKRDGLCYGVNYFAYDRGENVGDLRVWRDRKKTDFTEREASLIDSIGPSFVNALIRAKKTEGSAHTLRFMQLRDKFSLTGREAQIADILVIGLSDNEICAKLNISKSTLRSHIRAIFSKLNVCRRSQLSTFLNV